MMKQGTCKWLARQQSESAAWHAGTGSLSCLCPEASIVTKKDTCDKDLDSQQISCCKIPTTMLQKSTTYFMLHVPNTCEFGQNRPGEPKHIQ